MRLCWGGYLRAAAEVIDAVGKTLIPRVEIRSSGTQSSQGSAENAEIFGLHFMTSPLRAFAYFASSGNADSTLVDAFIGVHLETVIRMQ